MNAISFIKQNGVEKAREVVEGTPDKTATHYVFRKISNYYSVEFQSWFHDGEGGVPKDGGTEITWDMSQGKKIHVPIHLLHIDESSYLGDSYGN